MKRIIALSLAITTGAAMAYASENSAEPALDDAKAVQITQLLEGEGYDVQSIEAEDGGYEAYAMKDGTPWEIELASDLTITETEAQDDEDEDADHD